MPHSDWPCFVATRYHQGKSRENMFFMLFRHECRDTIDTTTHNKTVCFALSLYRVGVEWVRGSRKCPARRVKEAVVLILAMLRRPQVFKG